MRRAFGVFDEAIGERAGGERLARAGGHVDQARADDPRRSDFSSPVMASIWQSRMPAVASGCSGRHRLEPCAQGVGFRGPLGESFRPVKGEYAARARVGIALIAEERFDAGRFIEKRQRAIETSREEHRHVRGIARRLLGDAGEGRPFLLRFNYADRLAVDEQQVIARAGLQPALRAGRCHDQHRSRSRRRLARTSRTRRAARQCVRGRVVRGLGSSRPLMSAVCLLAPMRRRIAVFPQPPSRWWGSQAHFQGNSRQDLQAIAVNWAPSN